MNIFNLLSDSLFLSENELKNYVVTVPRRYKKFTIPKRNSTEQRLIAQPAREVKTLQRNALMVMKNYVPVHTCAHAYESNKNIKTNALLHSGNQFLLKMDFKNFFLSITPSLFLSVITRHGIKLSENDLFLIKNLFFWKLRRNSPLRLSIGAPSSPFISNATMYFFDEYLTSECDKIGVTYTRYADDLTFSTNLKGVLITIPRLVNLSLQLNNLIKIKINNQKTLYSSKKFNRHITGVTITNDDNISLGRDKKRLLSSLIHKYSLGLLNDKEIENLKGQLGFAKYIEPVFINRMKVKYGVDVILKLQKFNI